MRDPQYRLSPGTGVGVLPGDFVYPVSKVDDVVFLSMSERPWSSGKLDPCVCRRLTFLVEGEGTELRRKLRGATPGPDSSCILRFAQQY